MMDKAVTDTHCLLGSRLRDPDSGCQGRIVGIDQSRETPALLVNWSETGVARVPLSAEDLSGLVAASLAHERRTRDDSADAVGSSADAVGSSADDGSSIADDSSSRARPGTARRHEPPRRARSADHPIDDADGFRSLATGSDGRR